MRWHSLSQWTHHARSQQDACQCACNRAVVAYPKHQPHRCAHDAPEASSSPTAKRDLVVLFSADQVSAMQSCGSQLSGISLNHKPHEELHNSTKLKFSSSASSSGSVTQDEEELHVSFEDFASSTMDHRNKSRAPTLLASSVRSLQMVKAKLKAKLHTAFETSRNVNRSAGRRPGRTFSCESAGRTHCARTRQKRSGSLGTRVFRSRSVDRFAHPLSPPSTSMIFIDCP